MKPEEMRARSGEKVKQVIDLMKSLNLRFEARDRINDQGFIEKVVFYVDEEQYPQADAKQMDISSTDTVTATAATPTAADINAAESKDA